MTEDYLTVYVVIRATISLPLNGLDPTSSVFMASVLPIAADAAEINEK